MADSPNYDVPKRRRRKQKTDYQNRLELLKSGKPRAVLRLSNNNTRVQLVSYNPEGDQTETAAVSGQLEEYGWDHHTGNVPAAYLTGFLAAMKSDFEEAVLDTGLRSVKQEGRLFAAVKGLIDGGVEVPASEEAFPPEERIRGEHIEEMSEKTGITDDFEKVRENIEGEE